MTMSKVVMPIQESVNPTFESPGAAAGTESKLPSRGATSTSPDELIWELKGMSAMRTPDGRAVSTSAGQVLIRGFNCFSVMIWFGAVFRRSRRPPRRFSLARKERGWYCLRAGLPERRLMTHSTRRMT